jgi:hypothetical protein
MSKVVFVFATNERGIHDSGIARIAYDLHGARMKFSYGHMGNSFAIPFLAQNLTPLPHHRISQYVQGFLAYAHGHPELTFKVTQIGHELGREEEEAIARLFAAAPQNCTFNVSWKPFLGAGYHYWSAT